MVMKAIKKIFGSKSERESKKLRPIVAEINEIFDGLRDKPDDWFPRRTSEFKAQMAAYLEEIAEDIDSESMDPDIYKKEYRKRLDVKLDEILPEAFAMVKETCCRLVGKSWDVSGIELAWEMVPYDVQLLGGVVLNQGKIAEMATGEGKTLVATMPLYLNALVGKGAHLVTVNDYLARRDALWMGKVYEFLGLTIGCIQANMTPMERQREYSCDITYGTNNEFGFDYLRDNMAVRAEDQVHRAYSFAIVDEVDSVLIDEARTPLIISGPVESNLNIRFDEMQPLVASLVKKQGKYVAKLISEAEKILEVDGDLNEAAEKLLIAHRGSPKNKRLLKLFKEKGIRKLVDEQELQYRRDKNFYEIDDKLYFSIDEREHTVYLNDPGLKSLAPDDQKLFEIPDITEGLVQIDSDENYTAEQRAKQKEELYSLHSEKSEKNHAINQILRAYELFEKDVEYVVQEGKVLIVDEFTGRLMPGRRYSDGLHQAIEAKERVTIEGETQTLATITLQNYFRMYDKLSGMTGTAETEAAEFFQIYKLEVVEIPTNRPIRRLDYDDIIYRTRREKYNSIIEEIVRLHNNKIPVLVGTVSVETSETLSRMLKRQGIGHSVLNAKFHQHEAEIVAKAGLSGAVTIATNMAGRGTDIKLQSEVLKSKACMLIAPMAEGEVCPHYKDLRCEEDVPCGLHIIGTDLHESRRIDRQLRGRAGRQGDPGGSIFYISLEDDMMRIFGGGRIERVMDTLGWKEGESINHSMVTKAIERARKQVEYNNFSIRKNLLEYDTVMNSQRIVVYRRRTDILKGKNLKEETLELVDEIIESKVWNHCPEGQHSDEWNMLGLREEILKLFLLDIHYPESELDGLNQPKVIKDIVNAAHKIYEEKEGLLSEEIMRRLERFGFLSAIDSHWKEHLYEMDHLKTGIGLRAYGQRDPVIEYKKEAYSAFEQMMGFIDENAVGMIFKMKPVTEPTRLPQAQVIAAKQSAVGMGVLAGAQAQAEAQGEKSLDDGPVRRAEQPEGKQRPIRVDKTPGRNDPCPCGSKKKYKHCHGG
ncbi:MAG: preprotein translocase subunit SecA [candidate division Zixibacteria bacterium]